MRVEAYLDKLRKRFHAIYSKAFYVKSSWKSLPNFANVAMCCKIPEHFKQNIQLRIKKTSLEEILQPQKQQQV